MKKKKSQNITLESLSEKLDGLAISMETGFNRMDEGFREAKEDNEALARMVADGFEDVHKTMATKDDVARLETDVLDIKIRLDYLAPKFEVSDLEKRVKRLEDKAGLRHSVPR